MTLGSSAFHLSPLITMILQALFNNMMAFTSGKRQKQPAAHSIRVHPNLAHSLHRSTDNLIALRRTASRSVTNGSNSAFSRGGNLPLVLYRSPKLLLLTAR